MDWKWKRKRTTSDESGVWTHAPEGTRALTWRLRPLGHLAFNKSQQEYESGNVFQTVIEENNKGRNGEKGKFSYADSNRGREIQSLEC